MVCFHRLTQLIFGCLIADMNCFLLCIEKPKHEKEEREWNFWRSVSNHIEERTKTIQGVQKPCENVWLIPATKGVEALADCIQTCRSQGQKYQVLFLQEEPEICE
jgi:hypothetical protein